jgi:hypothetical protein
MIRWGRYLGIVLALIWIVCVLLVFGTCPWAYRTFGIKLFCLTSFVSWLRGRQAIREETS